MSPLSTKILRLLARGWQYYAISAHLAMRQERLHSHLYAIRKETGIKNTRDNQACKDYLYKHGEPNGRATKNGPSPAQLQCMVWVAKGRTTRQIGAMLNISSSTVRNHLASGMKTAGIKRAQIYPYLRDNGFLKNPPVTMDDPAFN